ncbi:MAG: hypothetical protein AB1779_02425 [Candidatus Thermoplasmatota archaeon]
MESVRKFNGVKYLWDGIVYNSIDEAKEKENIYKKDGFETVVFEEGGKAYIYTRRVVKEVKVEQ